MAPISRPATSDSASKESMSAPSKQLIATGHTFTLDGVSITTAAHVIQSIEAGKTKEDRQTAVSQAAKVIGGLTQISQALIAL
ncbi:hypothetical protein EG329_003093 [Mollisiaceae sp. DMI_Dod_QoI]|nr:hypothetical protein EG329_003093 [Helotiales sp. DMI_Dod_QoI]